MKTRAYATRPNIVLSLACTLFILPSVDAARGQWKSQAAPRVDDDPGGADRGGVDATRLVTGDPARIADVVAGTPPTAILAITPVNPPQGICRSPWCSSGFKAGEPCTTNADCPPMPPYPAGVSIDGQRLLAQEGGFRAWFMVQISNWDPNGDNVPDLGLYQVKIDCTGYASGTGAPLAPPVIPCTGHNLCAAEFGGGGTFCDSGTCMAGYLNRFGTPDFPSWCPGTNCMGGVATGTCNYMYYMLYPGRHDQHIVYNGGTLVLDIPPGAAGLYRVDLDLDETFLADTSVPPNDIPTLEERGFVVNIVTGSCCFALGTANANCIDGVTRAECGDDEPAPFVFKPGQLCSDGCCECVDNFACNDNDACTIEACNVGLCICERRLVAGFDPETECCDPSNGAVSTRIDTDQCTTDICSLGGSRGVAQHFLSRGGTPCNDWNVCTLNDACDGVQPAATGGCRGWGRYTAVCADAQCPEINPSGVQCDDLDPCTINDVCDAQGDCHGTEDEGCTSIPWPINCACDDPATRSIALLVPSSTPELPTALQVRLVDLQSPDPPNIPCCPPPDFSEYESGATCSDPNGCVRWVGKPGSFLESQDSPERGSFKAARLQCTPFYHDWWTERVVRVVGAEIIPSSEYSVQAYGASCKGAEAGCTNVSAAATISTGRYGDLEAPYNPPATSTQPDVTDIAQLVNKFKNVAGAPVKAIAQLQPNLPELNADINALDIVAVVDAVKQFAYAFSGPCACPSAVTCGPAAGSLACPGGPSACVTAFGPGSLCVKTCDSGTNAGDPCINNTHCPDGSCGDPFCRDRCGRCTP